MREFYLLPKETKKRIFQQVSAEKGLPAYAVEKDWWVVQALRVISLTEAADALIFKGGTSLSKSWDIIERFSEDVDLAIERSFLGFDEDPVGNKALRKLREKSRKYLTEVFVDAVKRGFDSFGVNDIKINYIEEASSSTDPTQIEIYYPNLIEHSGYLQPRVLLEIGSRSMMEPGENREVSSLVYQSFSDREFADKPVIVFTVVPERTFLEKVFLLHEEFQKPLAEIRVERMSRHLYDIEKIMLAGFADKAISDIKLYQDIVNHRCTMTKMKDVDYTLHQPQSIRILPPNEILEDYKKDYLIMCKEMIHGEKLEWHELVARIEGMNKKINSLEWNIEI